MIAAQVIVNISGMIGLAPATGIALPFISSSAFNLLANAIAVGFLVAVRHDVSPGPVAAVPGRPGLPSYIEAAGQLERLLSGFRLRSY